MSSKFIARPNKSLGFGQTVIKWIKAMARRYFGICILLEVFRPYETMPEKPEMDLPEETGEIPDAQLALCQAIFDDCGERRAHVEKKALWTFTAITFLAPVLASILVSLFQGKETIFKDHQFSLVLLILSAFLLFSSFISVLRAVAIRGKETLYIHAVIDENTGNFKDYEKKTHAQGLLHCAIRNTALNDHIVQFVKNAHTLLALATICFVLGTVFIGFQTPTECVH